LLISGRTIGHNWKCQSENPR